MDGSYIQPRPSYKTVRFTCLVPFSAVYFIRLASLVGSTEVQCSLKKHPIIQHNKTLTISALSFRFGAPLTPISNLYAYYSNNPRHFHPELPQLYFPTYERVHPRNSAHESPKEV